MSQKKGPRLLHTKKLEETKQSKNPTTLPGETARSQQGEVRWPDQTRRKQEFHGDREAARSEQTACAPGKDAGLPTACSDSDPGILSPDSGKQLGHPQDMVSVLGREV